MLRAATLWAAPACREAGPRGQARGPSDRIRIAIIGAGGYGASHADAYLRRPDCEIAHVVDVDRSAASRLVQRIKARGHAAPKVHADMRRAFDDPGVDIASFATPNHWHALGAAWAIDAGKHVYLEKPISHAIHEGAFLAELAALRGRICQSGTQHRSKGLFAEARKFLGDKKLGPVKVARCISFERQHAIGERGVHEPPEGVDYDLWCGPAEPKPIVRKRFHADWFGFWEYGEGSLGKSACHWLDLARAALRINVHPRAVYSFGGRFPETDAGECPNVQVALFAYEEQTIVAEVRGLGSERFRRVRSGIIFEGSEGYLVLSPESALLFDRRGRDMGYLRGPELGHFDNFVEAVRANQPRALNADLMEGHRSSALVHFANAAFRAGAPKSDADIAKELEAQPSHDDVRDTVARTRGYLLGRGLGEAKLAASGWATVDRIEESFADRKDAAAFLVRTYRKGFELPKI